jgi:hypothetical protein
MEDEEWRFPASPDERRLWTSLCLSALLHAAFFIYLKPMPLPGEQGDRRSVLSVSLAPSAAVASRSLEASVAETAGLESVTPAASKLSAADRREFQPPKPETEAHKVELANIAPKAAISKQPITSAGIQVAAPARGKVVALLVIDGSGRVQDIGWNELPAMTDDQLRQLERRIRQKTYFATGRQYTTTDSVEGLIGR